MGSKEHTQQGEESVWGSTAQQGDTERGSPAPHLRPAPPRGGRGTPRPHRSPSVSRSAVGWMGGWGLGAGRCGEGQWWGWERVAHLGQVGGGGCLAGEGPCQDNCLLLPNPKENTSPFFPPASTGSHILPLLLSSFAQVMLHLCLSFPICTQSAASLPATFGVRGGLALPGCPGLWPDPFAAAIGGTRLRRELKSRSFCPLLGHPRPRLPRAVVAAAQAARGGD